VKQYKNGLTRRSFVKLSGAGALTLYLGNIPSAFAKPEDVINIKDISPIDRTLGDAAPAKFFADEDPERAHAVLWNKASFLSSYGGKIPEPEAHVPLVIVGAGISGLTLGYLLKDHKPIILDQAPRFGGNSKGQSWRGIDYSIGAAYIVKPEEESPIYNLLKELGVYEVAKEKSEEGPFELNGALHEEFWAGATANEASAQFKKLGAYFKSVNDGIEVSFPEIPVLEEEENSYIEELDKISFKDHVEKIVGGKLHPQIEAALEQYCWSSFGGAFGEISAACGLNFYCAEFGSLLALPGGNSCVAELLTSKISKSVPKDNLKPNSLVFDVKVVDDGVIVAYRDIDAKIHSIHAKAVALCCPKFVVSKILNDIEETRLEAIRKLRYRSYLVGNVLLKGGIKKDFYDLYLLGDGNVEKGSLESAREQKVTDVILANFASPDKNHTVLTLYRGFPYDGVRGEIYIPGAYQRFRGEFEEQIYKSILPLLGLKKDDVVDIRVARWGHPLPLAATGLIAQGVPNEIRKPFKEKVFFVEQDNWGLPAFETSVTEALTWAPKIAKIIAS